MGGGLSGTGPTGNSEARTVLGKLYKNVLRKYFPLLLGLACVIHRKVRLSHFQLLSGGYKCFGRGNGFDGSVPEERGY